MTRSISDVRKRGGEGSIQTMKISTSKKLSLTLTMRHQTKKRMMISAAQFLGFADE